MIIAGIQKLGLVDFPGKVACTVFTGGCNLRCPYCHNFELVEHPAPVMSTEELFAFLGKRKGLLDGVCVTGGEPCVHSDLPEFLQKIRSRGFSVKLDTNGSFPDMVARVLGEKSIDYIAIDIKNGPGAYAETTGLKNYAMEPLRKTLSLVMDSEIGWELRTTVVKPFHTVETVSAMRDFLAEVLGEKGRKIPHYYLQKFVDRDTVPFAGLQAPSDEELAEFLAIMSPLAEHAAVRGE